MRLLSLFLALSAFPVIAETTARIVEPNVLNPFNRYGALFISKDLKRVGKAALYQTREDAEKSASAHQICKDHGGKCCVQHTVICSPPSQN